MCKQVDVPEDMLDPSELQATIDEQHPGVTAVHIAYELSEVMLYWLLIMLLNVLLLQLLEAMRKLQEVDARTGLIWFEIVVCKDQEVDRPVCPSTGLIVSASSMLQQGTGC